MMSHLALSRMKNGCDGIPVGAWKGFVEEGIDTVWDLTHGAETWAASKAQKKSDVAEIRMLRWMYYVTKMDRIRNERIRGTVKVAEISKKVHKKG